MNGKIYKFYCVDEPENIYIGQTIQHLEERKKQHFSSVVNEKIKELLEKYNYNRSKFKIECVEDDIDEDELNNKENYYIALFNSVNSGLNVIAFNNFDREKAKIGHELGKEKRKNDLRTIVNYCDREGFIIENNNSRYELYLSLNFFLSNELQLEKIFYKRKYGKNSICTEIKLFLFNHLKIKYKIGLNINEYKIFYGLLSEQKLRLNDYYLPLEHVVQQYDFCFSYLENMYSIYD